jgi:hypothetical protein
MWERTWPDAWLLTSRQAWWLEPIARTVALTHERVRFQMGLGSCRSLRLLHGPKTSHGSSALEPATSRTPRCTVHALLPAFVARPLIRLWLAFSLKSWQRVVTATDSPHVHARGTDPDRVLLVGDGVATGRGVLTHDLGLPGHLARSLTARTGRATDVDIVVDRAMTVRTCAQAVADIDLCRYDVVILSLGHNEALGLMSAKAWRTGLRDLLEELMERTAAATRIFLLPIPVFGPRTQLPPALARALDARVEKLDAITLKLAEATLGVTLVGDGNTYEFRPESSHVYRTWAEGVAAQISTGLDPCRTRAGDTGEVDEAGRQQAVRDLEALGMAANPALDELTRTAREVFGTDAAVITLVHADEMTMISTTGVEVVVPRHESFCDITIRRVGHVIIEDAALDSRYAQYPIVTGDRVMRFYAGYPIESPDGHRVGAFCVMHETPRGFTTDDVALLRSLAKRAQEILWRHR